MTRFEVIEKHYTLIRSISKKLTKDWEDLSHDLCLRLHETSADIIAIDQRGALEKYIRVTAYHLFLNTKEEPMAELFDIANDEEDLEFIADHPDDVEKLSKLSHQDKMILAIFAQGPSIREVARRTYIDRGTLSKLWNQARKNAQDALR